MMIVIGSNVQLYRFCINTEVIVINDGVSNLFILAIFVVVQFRKSDCLLAFKQQTW